MASILRDFGAARSLRVSGTDPLLGIDTTGLVGGEELTLCFVDGLTITAMGSPSFGAPIRIDHAGSITSLVCPADAVVNLVLITDSGTTVFWQYAGGSLGVGAGLLQPGLQLVTTVAGIVPVVTHNDLVVTADAGLLVAGMKIAGILSGTKFSLTFVNACTVQNQAAVGAGEAPFYLTTIGGDLMDADLAISSNILLQYFATELVQSPCFRLIGGPTK
jgi:hypothetical protein